MSTSRPPQTPPPPTEEYELAEPSSEVDLSLSDPELPSLELLHPDASLELIAGEHRRAQPSSPSLEPTQRLNTTGEERRGEPLNAITSRQPASWLPALITLVGVSLTFLIVSSLGAESALKQTLTRSPLSQVCTVALFWWGLSQLTRRWLQLRWERQHLALLKPKLSAEHLSALILKTLSERGVSLAQLRAPLRPFEHSLAGQMAWGSVRALYNEAHQGSVSYSALLQSADRSYQQSYERIEADYKATTAVMWLMPLSGFLGTVIGMSGSIASFDTVIASAGVDLKSLAPAVSGLATAFDTTLVALSLVVPLKLAEVSLERQDQALLSELDESFGAGLVDQLEVHQLDERARLYKNRGSQLDERDEHSEAAHLKHLKRLEQLNAELQATHEGAERAGEVLLTLTHKLQSLSAELGAPLSELTHKLDERALPIRELQQHLSQELQALREQLSGQASERAQQLDALSAQMSALYEQNERPLMFSRADPSPKNEPARATISLSSRSPQQQR